MAIHPTKHCRYCADEVDVEWLERHENKCKTKTPEQRDEDKAHRLEARERYRRNHGLSAPNSRERYRASMGVPIQRERSNGMRKTSSPCRYCHADIGTGQLSKHEAACRKKTPAERTEATELRARQRQWSRQHYQRGVAVVPKRGVGRPSHRSLFTNGNGRRLSATISIDFKSFREVLLQLAPMLSIDKVEVL
jgi:hypothetical protein